eukprot:scaffold1960_cov69-Cylindrotheca_fusiformis.AAC.3
MVSIEEVQQWIKEILLAGLDHSSLFVVANYCAAGGAGLGPAFLRHVQRCKVLLHVVDGSSEDPIGDFTTINGELEEYDPFLAQKPQVVVLNKIDIPEVKEKKDELMEQLRAAAGHSRVLSISAVTTERVQELMGRLKKFAFAQPVVDLPPIPEIDLGKAGLDYDSDDYEIVSDPSYPGQWRIRGDQDVHAGRQKENKPTRRNMTHWEYPEVVARFGRQLDALGHQQPINNNNKNNSSLLNHPNMLTRHGRYVLKTTTMVATIDKDDNRSSAEIETCFGIVVNSGDTNRELLFETQHSKKVTIRRAYVVIPQS